MKCHVIIPVGPGHQGVKFRALESVRIAMKTGTGPFSDVRVRMVDDEQGEMGRSAARNFAAQQSDADWLFFLDADDLMHPGAFEAPGAAYWDAYDAIWGEIWEYDGGAMLKRYQAPVREYADLLDTDPYLLLQMGHFVRRDVAYAHPFRESMDCGEDFAYYLDLWREHRCVKLSAPLMLNVKGQHSYGPRSATGAQWREAVAQLVADARERAAAA